MPCARTRKPESANNHIFHSTEKRELEFKEDGQEYARVERMLGNGRCEVLCFDGVKRLAHIRGKMRKKVWVGASDIILLACATTKIANVTSY